MIRTNNHHRPVEEWAHVLLLTTVPLLIVLGLVWVAWGASQPRVDEQQVDMRFGLR